MNRQGYVYIVSDRFEGRLWIGITSNLKHRIHQHQRGMISGFSKKYRLKRLVYFEQCPSIYRAIWRQNQMNAWKRAAKLSLIERTNPEWNDLCSNL